MASRLSRRLGSPMLPRFQSTGRIARALSTVSYEQAHAQVYGAGDPTVAFLGTGPMALSFVAQILSAAKAKNAVPPKMVLLTEQDKYYSALRSTGFKVLDESRGREYSVAADSLIVVKTVEEYEALFPGKSPQLVFGTQQMGQKLERWSLVKATPGARVTVLTAANGIPYDTMLDALRPQKASLNTGHATAYVKARSEFVTGPDGKTRITVTCADAGTVSIGAVGSEAAERNPWFSSVCALLDGPIYTLELSKNAKQEAMNKVVRNLTNAICFAATAAQYPFARKTSEIKDMRYGVHLEKKCFANTLNKATFEAGRALGFSAKEIAFQIVENLKYVMGPVAHDKSYGIDLDLMLHSFEDGLEDIMRLRKSGDGIYSRNDLFDKLSDKIMRTQLYNKISRKEVGSTHPPTDAQAAATAVPVAGVFGRFVPAKPVENKIKFILDVGLDVHNMSEAEARQGTMKILYGLSDLYDAYNEAYKARKPFDMPDAFFKVIEGCDDETRLLSNIDPRILKFDWRKPEIGNKHGISVSARRKQWLGESAIRNAKLIGELTAQGLKFLRFDVGGVALPEAEAVIEARKRVAAGNNKYSPLCEEESLAALAQFYSDTSAGRTFKPSEVMVLGMRAKGALPWMLDFVGNGPMFVPRPTYNPNPSAGLYHHRQVLSFDVTGPNRYLPMIQSLRLHKGGGIVVLPIIGNPFSTSLTEEEEAGFVEVLKANQTLSLVADHAYRGYNKHGLPGERPLKELCPTRDILEAGGFYDESPKDRTGALKNLRVTLHSCSKLFNDASGPGTCAGHTDTISFLGDMLRGSYTQAHARDRKVIPAIVQSLDYDAPRRWFANMRTFTEMTTGKVPGFRDLGYDCPPFVCYDASQYLAKHGLHPEEAQHYFMSRSPGLCGIFGGFGPGSNEIFRLGFTGESDPARTVLAAQKFIEYVNDEEAILKFKAREDDLTKNFFKLLDVIKAKEPA